MKTSKELQSLKEKMLAIQSGNYDVEAENPQIVRCWERLNCDQKDCPAYGKLRCWSIAGTCCRGEVTGKFARKLKDCRECVVYQESCGDDIGEIIETFNLMVRDLRHNVSEKLRSDREKAQTERLEEISSMAAGVAHETRNPLHSIGMAASYLKKKYHDELMDEFLAVIEEEVQKLNDLTALFLKFSNPPPPRSEPCDLNEVVAEAAKKFAGQAREKNVSLEKELDREIPMVDTDPARIGEILACLLENSLEAAGDEGTVILQTRHTEEEVNLVVRDDGPGIAEEDQEKIFKPFYTTKMNGPGLGLSIVERYARDLNGSVQVESEEGRGAVFTVRIPVNLPEP